MKKLVKTVLNNVPRPIMQRVANVAVPALGLLYLGRGKECPICGCKRKKFLPYGYVEQRDNALCPNCLSLERHRLMWLYLSLETRLLVDRPKLLHIAPEVSIMRPLKRRYARTPQNYITADLESPLADIHFDVQNIPLKDNFTEVIICNHIMEHVEDDRLAMRELYRVMAHGGWGIILAPIDYSRATTFEDDSITDPEERTRIFGQYDHRRIYGRDYSERLCEAGFIVEEVHYINEFTDEEIERFSLTDEILYVVSKL